MKHQQGIGLSEVLIALLLSSFILLILIQHYLATKKQYYHLQTTLEKRIDLQLVSELMRDSVRKAGFTPCLGIDQLVSIDQRDNPQPLVAIDVPSDGKGSLRINRMSDLFDTVLEIATPIQLLTTRTQALHQHQSILIADCYHAEVHHLSEVVQMDSRQMVMLNKPLAFIYHEPIYIGVWLEERYFIRKDKQGKGSLFYQHQHPEELTTAVHTLLTHLKQDKQRRLLQIILGLDNASTLVLETMVRAT